MKKILRPFCIVLTLIGFLIGYFWYGAEPQETIGGVIAGLGVSGFAISYAIQAKDKELEKNNPSEQ